MFRTRLLPVILALSLGSSSCWLRKPKTVRVFVPPPAKPLPPIVSEIPELPSPPEIDAKSEAELPVDSIASLPVVPPPAAPAPRRPTPAPRVATPTPPPVPDVTQPPPRLGQIFTAEQLREYNRNLDESLERVRKVLAMVGGRTLNRDLTEVVDRIQTFQRQAEQARETDLVTAVNLARRADLLAQDLLKRLP
jgi:hypothetical protein